MSCHFLNLILFIALSKTPNFPRSSSVSWFRCIWSFKSSCHILLWSPETRTVLLGCKSSHCSARGLQDKYVLNQILLQIYTRIIHSVIINNICASDILGNQEGWSKVQKEILSTQPLEVIEAYGEEYICSMQKRLTNMSGQCCADLSPVLKDLQHALLSKKPMPFYHPGHTAWAIPFLQRICPTWLFDGIFAHIFNYKKFCPAGVASK